MAEIDISTPGVRAVVKIDDCDLHLFDAVRWTPELRGNGLVYATRKPSHTKLYLHRIIMGAAAGQLVDHINRDGLDNRRLNLRIASPSENVRNRAGRGVVSFRGVHKKRDKWQAGITADGRAWALGCFDSAEAAAAAYDDALAYFGLTRNGLNLPNRTPNAKKPHERHIGPYGYPGVRQLPSGRFGARVIRDGRRFSIGTFDTAEEAARVAWEREHG